MATRKSQASSARSGPPVLDVHRVAQRVFRRQQPLLSMGCGTTMDEQGPGSPDLGSEAGRENTSSAATGSSSGPPHRHVALLRSPDVCGSRRRPVRQSPVGHGKVLESTVGVRMATSSGSGAGFGQEAEGSGRPGPSAVQRGTISGRNTHDGVRVNRPGRASGVPSDPLPELDERRFDDR